MAISGSTAVWITAVLCILCTITVGLRILARRQRKAKLGVDDYLLFVSLICVWALFVNLVIAVRWGLGQEFLQVYEKYGSVTGILKALLALEIIYGINLTFVKISILLMYRRIFTTRFFTIASWTISTVLLLWWGIVLFLTIFQCTPVPFAFNKTLILTHPNAHCINAQQFYIGNAVPNIVTDLIILALPVREVWKLQMKPLRKAAVMGMFLLGGLVAIISVIRLVSLFSLDLQNPNVTRDLTIPWIYTSIEPCIAIISACLPTLRPVILLVIPSHFKSTQNSNLDGSDNSSKPKLTPKPLPNTRGSGLRIFSSKAKKGDGDAGSFERLHEGRATADSEFTPKGYASDIITSVSANCGDVGGDVEEFPMHAIKTQRGLNWKKEVAPRTGSLDRNS